jgi:hypothetical protein
VNDWDWEAERYEMYSLGDGVFVFRLKAGREQGEAPHYLCADCFEKKKKGYLRPLSSNPMASRCSECEVVYVR